MCFTYTLLLSQEVKVFTDNDSVETKEEYVNFRIDFLRTIDFMKAVDIGSGNLELILKTANEFPDKYFVMEDIDSTQCNISNMHKQIEEFGLERVSKEHLFIQIGDTNSTNLASGEFDVVIVAGLIHEIDDKAPFFLELKRILKPNGSLIISDAFYSLPPSKHPGCVNRFMTIQEIDQVVVNQNLSVLKDWKLVGIKDGFGREYESRILQCTFEK